MANLFRMQSKCANTAGRPAACLHAWLLPFPIVQLFIMKWIVACMACHTGKYSSNRHIVDTEMKKKQLQRQWGTKCGRRLQKNDTRKKRAHTHASYTLYTTNKSMGKFSSHRINWMTHTRTPASKQAGRQAATQAVSHNIATTTTKKNVKRNNRIFI